MLLAPGKAPGTPTHLTPGFASAGHPDVSFDAQRVLFVAKRTASTPAAVWEMRADGTDARLVIQPPGQCIEAVYLPTIYTIDADEPVHQIALRTRLRDGHAGTLYTCRLDGSRVRRISFHPFGISNPYPLSDSRLLISVWSGSGTSALYTIHTDGTDLFPFAGVHQPAGIRGMPCELDNGWIAFVEATGEPFYPGGALTMVPRTRSLRIRRLVTKASDDLYRDPSPWPGGTLLVSCRPEGSGSYGLHLLDPSDGRRKARIYDDPEWDEMGGQALLPRREPSGHSSAVDERVDTGKLYCMDAYISDGREASAIPRGRIRHVRVLRGSAPLPAPSGRAAKVALSSGAESSVVGGSLLEAFLGEGIVEEDGSFFLEIPARTPLRLSLSDAEGVVLDEMQSWFWVMPQERRGCIGCHEDRERTPPNRHTTALRRQPDQIPPRRPVAPRKLEPRRRPYRDYGGGGAEP